MSIARMLSTKKIEESQKELLLNADISSVEADFIKPVPIEFNFPPHINNAVFKSKNAGKTVIKKSVQIDNCFCVGDKTEALLEKNGFSGLERAYQAKSLAEKIMKNHADKDFI